MIVALHRPRRRPRTTCRAGFTAFKGVQARLIIPHGHAGRGGYNWFDEKYQRDDEQTFAGGVARAEARVAGLLRELMRSRPTLGRPIVMGFSQGGIVTFALAARDPDHLGEAIPVAGLLPPPLAPASWSAQGPHPPIHASHGDQDDTIPVAKGRESVARLKTLGLDCTMHEVPGVAHQIRPQLDYVYSELAHAARAQAAVGVVHLASAAAAPPHADAR